VIPESFTFFTFLNEGAAGKIYKIGTASRAPTHRNGLWDLAVSFKKKFKKMYKFFNPISSSYNKLPIKISPKTDLSFLLFVIFPFVVHGDVFLLFFFSCLKIITRTQSLQLKKLLLLGV